MLYELKTFSAVFSFWFECENLVLTLSKIKTHIISLSLDSNPPRLSLVTPLQSYISHFSDLTHLRSPGTGLRSKAKTRFCLLQCWDLRSVYSVCLHVNRSLFLLRVFVSASASKIICVLVSGGYVKCFHEW